MIAKSKFVYIINIILRMVSFDPTDNEAKFTDNSMPV